jgi:RHS repeat-associated protein
MATQQLLATDRLLSPLMAVGAGHYRSAYTPYGYRPAQDTAPSLGFTGQLCEREVGWYLLCNGHRPYNPVIMRFHSADRLSPFAEGGINAYAYCKGDPVNRHDPSGNFDIFKILTASYSFSEGTGDALAFAGLAGVIDAGRVSRQRDAAYTRMSVLSLGAVGLGSGTYLLGRGLERAGLPIEGNTLQNLGNSLQILGVGLGAWDLRRNVPDRRVESGLPYTSVRRSPAANGSQVFPGAGVSTSGGRESRRGRGTRTVSSLYSSPSPPSPVPDRIAEEHVLNRIPEEQVANSVAEQHASIRTDNS